ncbi:unnamed protein product [Sphagnum compactum]
MLNPTYSTHFLNFFLNFSRQMTGRLNQFWLDISHLLLTKRVEVRAWAARVHNSGHLSPFTFLRRSVKFKILFCGVCHSDLHQIRNDWGSALYPMVAGYIVGEVTEVGSEVKAFQVGEIVGVGCMVNPAKPAIHAHAIWNSIASRDWSGPKLIRTMMGLLPKVATPQQWFADRRELVLKMPTNLPLDAAAPLLCAGITVYSPMKHYQIDVPDKHFGVVGLGGVGHMAVKFGKAFGMKVTVFSRSPSKEKEAWEVLGADNFIVSKDPEQMKAAASTIDYIIDSVAAAHPLDPYFSTLKIDGRLVVVGIPDKPLSINALSLINARRDVGGSGIGGIKETQEMLDFCGKHNITCMIEKIPMSYINTAMERLSKSDVKHRFVIDIASTLESKD